jgi:hypothetical protein
MTIPARAIAYAPAVVIGVLVDGIQTRLNQRMRPGCPAVEKTDGRRHRIRCVNTIDEIARPVCLFDRPVRAALLPWQAAVP